MYSHRSNASTGTQCQMSHLLMDPPVALLEGTKGASYLNASPTMILYYKPIR